MAQRKPEPEMKELLKRIYGSSKDVDLDRTERTSNTKKRK
jgi:hypothetical protein